MNIQNIVTSILPLARLAVFTLQEKSVQPNSGRKVL